MTEVGALRSVLLKRPTEAFVSSEAIEREWARLNYAAAPDLQRASDQYGRFVRFLEHAGVECHYLPRQDGTGLDSIYTRDASVACATGVILASMGKPARAHEPAAQREALERLGVPIVGAISGDGRLEGGDVVWLDSRTVAVGCGYRTNKSGIEQLRELLADSIDDLVFVPLPHWRGPDDVFHLMSMLSPIDADLALVYSPLLPALFREALLEREIELVEVPDEEFETMGCNVLAVAPRRCIALAGNPITKGRLEAAGATVEVYEGSEISVKGAGGPTCLTRPLVRM
jgi:N-dimethylarginine dimethylaminohydrolase